MHDRLKHMKETLMCAVEMELCNLGEVDTAELGEVIDMIKDLEEAIYYCTVTEAMNNSSEMEFEMKKNGQHQKESENGNGQNHMYYDGSRNERIYRPYDDRDWMYAERRRRADGTFYADGGQMYAEGGRGGGNSYAGGGSSQGGGGSSYAEGGRGGGNDSYAENGRGGGRGSSYADGGMGTSYNAMNGGSMYADSMPYMEESPMYRDSREGRSYNSRRMYMEAKDMKRDKATQLRELEKYMQELSQDITEMIGDASPEEKQYLEKKITALASKIGQMK